MRKEDFVKMGIDEETAKKLETASLEELKGYIPKARFDEDDLKLLIAKRFLLCFDNGVVVIKHWRMYRVFFFFLQFVF